MFEKVKAKNPLATFAYKSGQSDNNLLNELQIPCVNLENYGNLFRNSKLFQIYDVTNLKCQHHRASCEQYFHCA